MNIKNIIGLGLLAYFTNCTTNSNVVGLNDQTNCILAKPTQTQQPQPQTNNKPAPIVCNDAKPQNSNKTKNDIHFHVRRDGKIEISTKQWRQ
jgi:hypothetical protein